MASKRSFNGAAQTAKNEYREGDNRYMAPETLQGVFTSRADVFSLGMTVLCVICDIELPKNGEMWHKVRHVKKWPSWVKFNTGPIGSNLKLTKLTLKRDLELL